MIDRLHNAIWFLVILGILAVPVGHMLAIPGPNQWPEPKPFPTYLEPAP